MEAERAPLLRVEELTKTFYGVPAVDRVGFDLRAGEIHGLLGENGAGKSTLCSVLAGLYRPDAGRVLIDGEPVELRSPHDAARRGIGMVYQHFRLVESFTVWENIALGLRRAAGNRSRRHVEARVEELSTRYGLDVAPSAHVWQLSVGEQQRVEILKQLYRGARILILDEPTAVLAPTEADRLYEAVVAMARGGHAVVLVSHKMHEILDHTDRVTVLRRGCNAGAARTADVDVDDLARMVFGEGSAGAGVSSEAPVESNEPAPRGEVVLSVRELSVRGDRGTLAVDHASFDVHRGEIVGVAGVAGNGQRELQEAIAGLRPVTGGAVQIGDLDCTGVGPGRRARAGLAYVPEDRLGTGLAAGLPIDHNLALRSHRHRPHSRLGVLRPRRMRESADELVEAFDVRGARAGMQVSLMSGGNLQKSILARELTTDHDVLVAAAPTRGLDLAAARTVRGHLRRERDAGRGVLLFSEDLHEVLELADTVLVVFQGRVVGAFPGDQVDRERVGRLMIGADEAVA